MKSGEVATLVVLVLIGIGCAAAAAQVMRAAVRNAMQQIADAVLQEAADED